MPSFDIVSKVEAQALENAVNVTTKEITNRFDFKGSHVLINLDKKEYLLKIETEDDMKMRQLIDVLISRAHKQGIAPEAFDASKEGGQSGKTWKKEVKVKNGLAQEDAKKIVKLIKDSGMKVQASINDDMVRVTGKKIDGFYYCIHHTDDNCTCRKPEPGLFFRASSELRIDLKQSFMIGDSDSDIIAAERAGCKGIKIESDNVDSSYLIKIITPR